jgi:hypothetical protein
VRLQEDNFWMETAAWTELYLLWIIK